MYEDPDPAPYNVSKEQFERRRQIMIQFGDEMSDAFSGVNSEAEELWIDFIPTFRLHSIDAWPNGLTYKWCNSLRSRGVHVDNGRKTSLAEALKCLLSSKSPIQSKSIIAIEKDAHPEYAPPYTLFASKTLDQSTPGVRYWPSN